MNIYLPKISFNRFVNDGMNYGEGNLDSGIGPVTINNFIPTGAVTAEIIPLFNSNLPVDIEQEMVDLSKLISVKNHDLEKEL